MLRIRLTRVGKKNQAIYRIVVAEHARPVKGKFIEVLGTYNPRDNKDPVKLNKDRITHWLKNGALPSDTVAGILKKENILPEKIQKIYDLKIEHQKKTSKKKKKKEKGGKEAEAKEPAAPEAKEKTKEEKPAAKETAGKKEEAEIPKDETKNKPEEKK